MQKSLKCLTVKSEKKMNTIVAKNLTASLESDDQFLKKLHLKLKRVQVIFFFRSVFYCTWTKYENFWLIAHNPQHLAQIRVMLIGKISVSVHFLHSV